MATDQPTTVAGEPEGLELIVSRMSREAKQKFDHTVLLAMNSTRITQEARSAGAHATVRGMFESGEAMAWDALKEQLQTAYSSQISNNSNPDWLAPYRSRR